MSLHICLLSGERQTQLSKPCLCLSDTHHFHHFCRFQGSEERSPCFQWVECKFVIFVVFVKTGPFWQGRDKNTVYQEQGFVSGCQPDFCLGVTSCIFSLSVMVAPFSRGVGLSGTKIASPNCSDHGGRKRARKHSAPEIARFFASPGAKRVASR